MAEQRPPVEQMSFEAALAELETIVKGLETGATSLEASIDAYERGVSLRRHCEQKLAEARSRIETISIGADGAAKTAPFTEE